MKILIVDDEIELRDYYESLFDGDAVDLVQKTSVCEAQDYLATERPDLIITDLLMPDGNGMKVIDEAKKLMIPCIILSGYTGAYAGILPSNVWVLEKTAQIDMLRTVLKRLVLEVNAAIAS